jgi:Uma2 family endonuclease
MPVEFLKRRFDVDDYHRMAEAGILTEDDRVELIDGEILAITPIGPRHNAAVNRANRALVTGVGDRAIVQVQGSVRLDRFNEPQPDLVLLRPQHDFYASRLPGPADILLIIEIAESSLQYDQEVKTRIYAEAGVPEYWLVNVDQGHVSCFTDARDGAYRNVVRDERDQSLAPASLPECLIPVRVLTAH